MTLKKAQKQALPINSQPLRIWLLIERTLEIGCAITLLSMAGLTGIDVFARYVLNAPIQGAFELTEVLLVCLIFGAMPLATKAKSHVEVELWNPKSNIQQNIRIFLFLLSGISIFAVLSYQLFEHGQKLAKRGSVTNSLDIPLSYIAYLAAICCALSVIAVAISITTRNKG